MLRFPIGVKLIIMAIALVSATTAALLWLAGDTLERTYRDQAQRLRIERRAELERRSVAVAHYVGDTAGEALAGTEAARLGRILKRIAGENPEISVAAIADEQGRLLAHSEMSVDEAVDSSIRFDVGAGMAVSIVERRGHAPVREVTYPIEAHGPQSTIVGYLRLEWSTRQLQEDVTAIERDRDRDLHRARLVMGMAGVVAVAAGILAGILGGVRLGRPIRRLASTARAISEGDLRARADTRGRDEISDLAVTMNHMAAQLETLVNEARVHAELDRELALARAIQQQLLPARGMIRRPGLSLAGLVEPASDCGGDWWAWANLTRQRTLVFVGDVTGHGISSAMLTATARSCLDTVLQLTGADFRVGYLLEILDKLLREGGAGEYHMTAFASIVDPLEGTLTYANAGHHQPFLLRWTGSAWRQGRLKARGNCLGDGDGHAFVEHTVTVQSRDLLCWYTDGLVEALDTREREFGARRLRASLARRVEEQPDEVLRGILGDFDAHRAADPLEDDVTCVIGRILA